MSSAKQPLSAAVYHILLTLAEEDRHGYAIMREAQASGIRMGPGTLYGSIRRLIEEGQIEEASAPDVGDVDERRRYYRLTDQGRGALQAESSRLADLVRRAIERGILPAAAIEGAR